MEAYTAFVITTGTEGITTWRLILHLLSHQVGIGIYCRCFYNR